MTGKLFSKDVEAPDKYEVEKLGEIRDAIYEKYAKKVGMDVNELKDRLEAYKAQKEEMEPDMDSIAQHTQFYNKEGVTYAGSKAVDDAQKDPAFGSLSSTGKVDAINKLKQGGTVTVG